MAELYEILIRRWPDGKMGAHVRYYKADGKTPEDNPRPLNTADFPAALKTTIEQLIGVQNAALLSTVTQAEAKCAVAEGERARAGDIIANITRSIDRLGLTTIINAEMASKGTVDKPLALG